MWLIQEHDHGMHITPLDDFREHQETEQCWCCPTEGVEEPGVWLHRLMDGREDFENGVRLPS